MAVDRIGGDSDLASFGQLQRIALSSRLCVSRSSRTGSPVIGAVELRGDLDASGVSGTLPFRGDVLCDVGQVDRRDLDQALFAAGEGEQAVDEAFVAQADGQQSGAELA
jgi:hypothetical protein